MNQPYKPYYLRLKEENPELLHQIQSAGGRTSGTALTASRARLAKAAKRAALVAPHLECDKRPDWTVEQLFDHDWKYCPLGLRISSSSKLNPASWTHR